MFPIKPGERNSLAGTMGELRSSHFHTGIDIRTEGRTGLPVYAVADGYISRAVISSSGYGNALYVLHPNGHTSVYAHLEKFNGEIADYMRSQQYKNQIFKIDLSLPKDKFKVSKGDIIAGSGNSGSSGGPHLHFDIRDAYQRPLNPLSFGFEEILDRTPPVAEKIILKTLDIESRVNGQFGQREYRLQRIGNDYFIEEPLYALGQIGMMLDAHDKLDYSRFRCGINTITVEVNGISTFEQRIDKFKFSEQKEIYRHMSYEDLRLQGERYNKLYIDDGNNLDFYLADKQKGKLNIEEGDTLKVAINMIDTYGNRSVINYEIIGSSKKATLDKSLIKQERRVIDNTLVLQLLEPDTEHSLVYNGTIKKPSYLTASSTTYLMDLRYELPKVLEINNEFETLNFHDIISSGYEYTHYGKNLDLFFQKKSLFDTLYFESDYYLDSLSKREIWSIGNELIPLRKSIKVTLKPNEHYNQEKIRVYQTDNNGSLYFEGGKWDNDRISFWTRSFGQYTLDIDTIPPTIRPIRVNGEQLRFVIKDERSGLHEFNCYINDEWVLMNYDHKKNVIWSEKLNSSKPFKGEIKLIVKDNVNNQTEYISTIN